MKKNCACNRRSSYNAYNYTTYVMCVRANKKMQSCEWRPSFKLLKRLAPECGEVDSLPRQCVAATRSRLASRRRGGIEGNSRIATASAPISNPICAQNFSTRPNSESKFWTRNAHNKWNLKIGRLP